jgi:hypothetical protein
MSRKRIGRDGKLIEMGGEADLPQQIVELGDDISTLRHMIQNLEFVLDTGDLREFDIPNDIDKLPNFRREIDALAGHIEALSHDVQEDFAAMDRRIAALESAS